MTLQTLLFYCYLCTVLAPMLWVQAAAAASELIPKAWDCSKLTVGDNVYDLSSTEHPLQVSSIEETPPTSTRTTIDLDLCNPLPNAGSGKNECVAGTHVCVTVTNLKAGAEDRIVQVIPVVTQSADGLLPWSAQAGELLASNEHAVELALGGGSYAGRNQKLEIELECDHQASKSSYPHFRSYDHTAGKLKLRWPSRVACAQQRNNGNQNDNSGSPTEPVKDVNNSNKGWGFFSWFFFLLFVGFVAYFALGMWRNYSEYGVVEIPHKDFWREAPYIAQDMGRHLYKSIFGPGRTAYEPL